MLRVRVAFGYFVADRMRIRYIKLNIICCLPQWPSGRTSACDDSSSCKGRGGRGSDIRGSCTSCLSSSFPPNIKYSVGIKFGTSHHLSITQAFLVISGTSWYEGSWVHAFLLVNVCGCRKFDEPSSYHRVAQSSSNPVCLMKAGKLNEAEVSES